jgi:hypothetical protein
VGIAEAPGNLATTVDRTADALVDLAELAVAASSAPAGPEPTPVNHPGDIEAAIPIDAADPSDQLPLF